MTEKFSRCNWKPVIFYKASNTCFRILIAFWMSYYSEYLPENYSTTDLWGPYLWFLVLCVCMFRRMGIKFTKHPHTFLSSVLIIVWLRYFVKITCLDDSLSFEHPLWISILWLFSSTYDLYLCKLYVQSTNYTSTARYLSTQSSFRFSLYMPELSQTVVPNNIGHWFHSLSIMKVFQCDYTRQS